MPDTSPALQRIELDRVGPVWIREGTSDYAVFEQIFHTEEFNISTAPQFAWIRAAYDRMLAAGETPLVIDCCKRRRQNPPVEQLSRSVAPE